MEPRAWLATLVDGELLSEGEILQGQIATKLKGFNRGVTVTAGLATVFTTPAHGTAFDIVGRGKATTGALEQAVRLAARLAVNSGRTRIG